MRILVRCGLVAASVLAGLVAAAAPARAVIGGNVLYAGQSTTTYLASANGRFMLHMFGDSMGLTQEIDHHQVDVWGTKQYSLSALTGAKLAMQRDGNLVLRNKSGTVMWSTHTAGTGRYNKFLVYNSGNLAVYTSSGRRVWQSGSGPAMMRSGSTLESGHYLRSRYDDTTPWVRLIMEPDGNLVLTYNGQARWSTNTHVAGSRLHGNPDGNWVIYTPSNRAIWSTRTSVHAPTFLMALPAGHAANLQVSAGAVLFEVTA